MSEKKTSAHLIDGLNLYGRRNYPDGLVPWKEPDPPSPDDGGRSTGLLRRCAYCGSMHPSDVVAAIKAGARLDFADQKYGWPHKVYLHGVPNPHAGLRESNQSCNFEPETKSGEWIEVNGDWKKITISPETTWGKFYSVHLIDATDEEREIIARAMGIRIRFADGKVSWEPYMEKAE